MAKVNPDKIKKREDEWSEIFVNNIKWAEEKISKDPNYFIKLSKLQQPDFLWIGCSDSRVPANEIIGLQPGEVFVHRNIANLIIPTDINAQSVIAYAVNVLQVKHIIVTGHYGCGGVKHSMENTDNGFLNPWLTHIDDVYRLHAAELDAITDHQERFDRLVELNTVEACINLMKNYIIQKSFAEKQRPVVHACVYDLKNGILKDLKVNFEDRMKEFWHIYGIDAEALKK